MDDFILNIVDRYNYWYQCQYFMILCSST